MATPTVWVLLGKGAGGNGQMKSLAAALGWPHEAKQLVYNRRSSCPNLLLGASLLGIDRRASSPLEPPWPDLVIAGSRRSAPVALWIRKQSGGKARLVHLMHTQAPLDWFDLVITTPQYRLPERPNVLHNSAPLNPIPPARLAEAGSRWRSRFEALPRPQIALLVGGNSSSYILDSTTARRLGRQASAAARRAGGSLLVSTSARTSSEAASALVEAIDVPAHVYRWQPNDAENPYLGYLALADRFVITVDSASLLAEACAAGKPVEVFEWPVRPDRAHGLKGLLRRWAARSQIQHDRSGAGGDALTRLYDRLVYLGLIKPPRDFAALHAELRRRGLLTRFADDEPDRRIQRRPLDDMQRAVERVRALFADEGSPS